MFASEEGDTHRDHFLRLHGAGPFFTRVRLQEEGNPVEQVGQAAQEKAALAHDHDPPHLAAEDAFPGKAHVGNPGGNVSLGGSPALEAVLLHEAVQFRALQDALLHAEGCDHFVVGQGHITGARGGGDLRVLHFHTKFVHIGDGQAHRTQGIGHQGGDHRLGRRTCADAVASDAVGADDGADAVIGADQHSKGAQYIFQDRHIFLNVIPAVHAQLGYGTAPQDHNVLVDAGFHQSRGVDNAVGWSGAEGAGVGTGGVDAAAHFADGLGEVAAAPLVHIAAGLFGGFDNVLHNGGIKPVLPQEVPQGPCSAGFGRQVLKHHIGLEVYIPLVGLLHAAHDLALEFQGYRGLLVQKLLDIREGLGFPQNGQVLLCKERMAGELFHHGLGEALFQDYQVEGVGDLHHGDQFVQGEDLAKAPLPFGLHRVGVPRLGDFRQLFRCKVADIHLVGRIGHHFLKGPQGFLGRGEQRRSGVLVPLNHKCCAVG